MCVFALPAASSSRLLARPSLRSRIHAWRYLDCFGLRFFLPPPFLGPRPAGGDIAPSSLLILRLPLVF